MLEFPRRGWRHRARRGGPRARGTDWTARSCDRVLPRGGPVLGVPHQSEADELSRALEARGSFVQERQVRIPVESLGVASILRGALVVFASRALRKGARMEVLQEFDVQERSRFARDGFARDP